MVSIILQKINFLFCSKLARISKQETSKENIIEHFNILSGTNNEDSPAPSHELIFGEYAVKGSNPSDHDHEYFGSLQVSGSNDNITAKWKIGFSNDLQTGNGFVHQGYLFLAFSYFHEKQKYSGKVIYKTEGETLTGYWIEPGCKTAGWEQAVLKNRW